MTLAHALRVYGLVSFEPALVPYGRAHNLSFAGVLPLQTQGYVEVTGRACQGTGLSPAVQGPQASIWSPVPALAPGLYAVCYYAGPASVPQRLERKLTVSGVVCGARAHCRSIARAGGRVHSLSENVGVCVWPAADRVQQISVIQKPHLKQLSCKKFLGCTIIGQRICSMNV